MALPKATLWPIDPHTKAKHEILRRYLEAWFPILNTHHQRIVYIDGFCGPGRYDGGEQGSPMIVLDAAVNHRRQLQGELVFVFIDERQDRIQHLTGELGQRSIPKHFKVHVECGKFDEQLEDTLNKLDTQKATLAPTFAFIDPFGFSGIPFKLIERLLKHRRCEALITFQADAMNRFLGHPEPDVVKHIVNTFGTDQVLQVPKSHGDRITNLRTLYQSQLRTLARFVRYFEMRDRNNRVQYYLFFASNNALGHLKMKEAMWKLDPEGEFRFSDATDPNQPVLFEADTTTPLLKLLQGQFGGKGIVSAGVVRKYVEDDTPYIQKHMTAALRVAEDSGTLKVEPKKADGSKRRARTYPDLARMAFK